jgi:anhydro-N-acetylmuramic acid kinase
MEHGTAEEICALNFALGAAFGSAAVACAREAGVPLQSISAIASHGQTIWHAPPGAGRSTGSTLQIGEPALIARATGRPVASNFRPADMALGGQGAPLVPVADHVLFGQRGRTVAVQNIGGMANVTVVTPRRDEMIAFDTGPGNSLMDSAMQALMSRAYDRDGSVARRGRADARLLGSLMRTPFLRLVPPKSTGRETFGPALLARIMKQSGRLRPEDMMATLAAFTAESIADAYERFIRPRHKIGEVLVSGGGALNRHLMDLLKSALAPLPVRPTTEVGIPVGAREAMAFAILAHESLMGRPGNLPSATGASAAVPLGSLTLP